MKAKQLSNLEIDEISLVDVPAIRKKFVIIKSGKKFGKNQDNFHKKNEKEVTKMLEKLIEIFKKVNGLEEISDEQMEVLKALSEDDMKKYSESLEVIEKYKGELPDDLNKELSELAKFGVREIAKKEEDKKEEEDLEKAGKKLSKDTLNVIASAVKELGGIAKTVEDLANLLPKEDTEKMAAEKKAKEDEDSKIAKAIEKVKEELKEEITKKDESIEKLTEKVEELEKTSAGKQSLEEEGSDDDDEGKDIKKDAKFTWKFVDKI